MATEGMNQKVSVLAGADLRSGAQYKAIAVGGTIAAANDAAIGILQNKPNTGENASLAFSGHMKAYVGGAVTAGGRVKVTTSGYLVAVASGDGAVGKAITAAASGAICEIIADFTNAATTV